jgi:hypothetical protein
MKEEIAGIADREDRIAALKENNVKRAKCLENSALWQKRLQELQSKKKQKSKAAPLVESGQEGHDQSPSAANLLQISETIPQVDNNKIAGPYGSNSDNNYLSLDMTASSIAYMPYTFNYNYLPFEIPFSGKTPPGVDSATSSSWETKALGKVKATELLESGVLPVINYNPKSTCYEAEEIDSLGYSEKKELDLYATKGESSWESRTELSKQKQTHWQIAKNQYGYRKELLDQQKKQLKQKIGDEWEKIAKIEDDEERMAMIKEKKEDREKYLEDTESWKIYWKELKGKIAGITEKKERMAILKENKEDREKYLENQNLWKERYENIQEYKKKKREK